MWQSTKNIYNFKLFQSIYIYINCIIVIANSATMEPIAAPIAKYFGIKMIFKIRFITAP